MVNTYINEKLKVSLKLQAFPSRAKQKEEERMRSTPAGGLHSTIPLRTHLRSSEFYNAPGKDYKERLGCLFKIAQK